MSFGVGPALLLALALDLGRDPFPFAAAEAELSAAINVEELKAHVYRLASPECRVRRRSAAARSGRAR